MRLLRQPLLSGIVLLIVTTPPLWADAEVVATVGDQSVSRAELMAEAAPAVEQIEMQRLSCQAEAEQGRHVALEDALHRLVRRHLLDREMARTGESEALVEARMFESVKPVTQHEIEQFYVTNRTRIRYPLNEVAEQIRDLLEQQRQTAARDRFFADLEIRFAVEYRLPPMRFAIATDGFPSHGPLDAPVTIVECSDFQCPFCARILPVLEQVKRHYGDAVRLVYRHFPLLSIHPHAQKAAEASLCAHEQGRFWELHDLMFAEQNRLAIADLKAMARRLGLDEAAFASCLDSGRLAGAVRADRHAGSAAGVTGTPAIFVNGRPLTGAVPFSSLAAVIDDELSPAPDG